MLGRCEEDLDLSEAELLQLGAADVGELRFLALYVLLLIHWRRFDYPRYRELVDRHAADIDETLHPYFLTFRSQYYFSRGDDLDDMQQALDYATSAAELLPEGPAVLHLMASATARVAEAGGEVSAERFAAAERAIAAAIRLDRDLFARGQKPARFARYHATRARLLTLRQRHREARSELHKALELEDPNAASRIAEYLEIRGQISLSESVTPVKDELEALSERIEQEAESLRTLSTEVADEIRLQAVQLLGLLAAVLALLFTGTEIARKLSFDEASKLMAVVSGAILIVFSGFSLIFYAERITFRRAVAALLAAALGGSLLAVGLLV
jgi:tetratricopeptide (TPR) repeat protein